MMNTKTQSIQEFELNHIYISLRELYRTLYQMTALIITAWGILVGLGIETRRGVVLIISSILLFVLVYLFWRIGRLLDGFLQKLTMFLTL